MYGKSYGRTTNLVTTQKLDDYNASKPWVTTSQLNLVDQGQVHQLQAADVVGIEDKYKQVFFKLDFTPSIRKRRSITTFARVHRVWPQSGSQ